MRLAMITPGYAPAVGGLEAVVTALCTGLREQGIDVEVWSHRQPGASDASGVVDGVLVRRFATIGAAGRFPISPALWRHARRRAHEFDAVHAHGYHATAAVAAFFAPHEVPLVFTPHYHGGGHTLLARALHPPYRLVGRRLFHRSQRVVAVSEAEGQLLTHDAPRVASKLRIIHNAVDVETIRSAQPFTDAPPTALVLGRLEPYKRVDEVIAAFGALTGPGQLVILGTGSDAERLQGLAAASPRARDIRLLGRVARDEVDRWLRTARCVVSMSEHEAFGIVGLEGAAAGASVLLSDLPAHREVVDLAGSDRCTIVTRGRLAAHLEQALQVPTAAPRHVRDWSAVVSDHLDLYRTVVGP